jgi:copper homeostasis protein
MTDNKNYILEIATSDFETTKSAVEGMADRIELCANLAEGGTTPSYAMIRQCRNLPVLIYTMVRPRGGDFLYTEEEFEIMLHDIMLSKQLGCDGIVIGALNPDGSIDITRTIAMVEMAYPMGVTFHRAFDRCREPFEALEQLIDAGCERILTSGQKPIAADGSDLIRQLLKIADSRITIMPGSGVNKNNFKLFADAGCTEFHASLRSKTKSKMQFIQPAFETSEDSYSNNFIDKNEVLAFKQALTNSEL